MVFLVFSVNKTNSEQRGISSSRG